MAVSAVYACVLADSKKAAAGGRGEAQQRVHYWNGEDGGMVRLRRGGGLRRRDVGKVRGLSVDIEDVKAMKKGLRDCAWVCGFRV